MLKQEGRKNRCFSFLSSIVVPALCHEAINYCICSTDREEPGKLGSIDRLIDTKS